MKLTTYRQMCKKKRKQQRIQREKVKSKLNKGVEPLLRHIEKTIKHFCPKLSEHIDYSYTDPRRVKSVKYKLSEVLLATVFMYMMRTPSRNDMNEERTNIIFKSNYEKYFKLKLPHMDTVNNVLEALDPSILESIKRHIIKQLLSKRTLHKFKLLGRYFIVAIDGTGVYKYKKEPYPGCPYKVSKNNVKTYTQSVVEAKLIGSNGFSISLVSEWIINEDGKTKQDCEQNATKRLIKKLKAQYPRLPILILLDGLFGNAPMMKIIKENNWEYLIVWKDKTLYSLQDLVAEHRSTKKTIQVKKEIVINRFKKILQTYEYDDNQLDNKGNKLYYIKMEEEKIHIEHPENTSKTKFVFMSSISPDNTNFKELIKGGRLRWKIENEGFNTQKRKGYNMHHKMNRKNLTGIKNYYNCLQIGHLLNQLIILCQNSITKQWRTVKKLWQYFTSALRIIKNLTIIQTNQKYNYRY